MGQLQTQTIALEIPLSFPLSVTLPTTPPPTAIFTFSFLLPLQIKIPRQAEVAYQVPTEGAAKAGG
jgi:hypothetical protein